VKKGIDISQYQKNIDFAKVKASGIDYVIIRAGYGKYTKQKDPQFETHYKNATAAGLSVGAYWYSYASSVEDAKLEAQACLAVIKGKKFDYPIYFDLEESTQFAKGKSFCDSIVKAFCGELESAGYYAGLYISRSPLQQYISTDVANKYALWIAEYATKCNYSGDYGMWQYTSSGTVNGISGNVDRDYCYVDYPTKIKSAGKNGYVKSSTTKTVLDTTGFKRGDKSDGVLALKQLLILAGYNIKNDRGFGAGTEKAVNKLLKKWGYKENGIAGAKFIKKLGKKI
jgi:GH25 family lysozyme M1 (1,4-beta-N-acetylmuramidase)